VARRGKAVAGGANGVAGGGGWWQVVAGDGKRWQGGGKAWQTHCLLFTGVCLCLGHEEENLTKG